MEGQLKQPLGRSLALLPFLLFPLLSAATDASRTKISFRKMGKEAGVRHVHHTRSFKGRKADILEMFTSGGAASAVGDYDGDGLEDLFITCSEAGHISRLFRNQGNLKFSDVTEAAGLGAGNDPLSAVADALWFDYDNDSRLDLVVARLGTALLYHNEGNGRFRDVTASSGFSDRFANSLAIIAFDYDNDGYLDLLFGNYFPPLNLLDLKTSHVLPDNLDNANNGGGVTLWRNNTKGAFVERTAEAGLARHSGWTLDAGHGDFNNDGLQDVYLACDFGTDRLFLNRGDGSFRDATDEALGYDTKKGMNAEVADYDNDGWMDVYVTNITDEYMRECNMLWNNNGDGTFTDLSKETGTCNTLWGWGAKFADFDNDGWQDLYAVNGMLSAGEENYIPVLLNMILLPGVDFTDLNSWPDIGNRSWSGYQKSKFFQSLGGDLFKEISSSVGLDNDSDGRGVAIADFDNDGLLDIYQTNANQPSLFYRNQSTHAGNWIQLKLIGTDSNRDAIGARITLKAGDLTLTREVAGGNGYSSQSSTRVHFGIGPASQVDSLRIRWPSGRTENLAVPLNQILWIQEGQGIVKRQTAGEVSSPPPFASEAVRAD